MCKIGKKMTFKLVELLVVACLLLENYFLFINFIITNSK